MEMNRVLCMAVLGALAMTTMLQPGTAQTAHVVGDNIGWSIPSNGAVAYSNWVTGKTFNVGDILVFNFATNQHDVLRVPKASFDGCTSANAIGNAIMNGPANVTLNSAGEHYYICTFGRHCQAGQKLALTVTGNAANRPPTAPTPSTPTTPSPTSSALCSPTADAPSPSHSTSPGVAGNTPSSPDSSSPAVVAGFLFTLAPVALALFV
ncbi:PREDICTED: cucumber peeling cupredoxin-like [Ipomoea nil]|uniref:cucumber peeling cupredoxin-like n=1 Tax=Ipomoea nil TaxID=35883 RepID=UPI000900FA7B|nr:PREDICTED: cucumber peeling cupredoxin-like [Ipomoea nil]